jgi:hypothetical protein
MFKIQRILGQFRFWMEVFLLKVYEILFSKLCLVIVIYIYKKKTYKKDINMFNWRNNDENIKKSVLK